MSLLKLFQRFKSETLTPNLEAIPDKVSPRLILYVVLELDFELELDLELELELELDEDEEDPSAVTLSTFPG